MYGKNLSSKYISQPVGSNHQSVENTLISREKTASLFLINPEGLHFYLKETPAQVFSCKICNIFKNAYFEEHLQTASFTLNLVFLKHQQDILSISFDELCFSLHLLIHVMNLLFNDVICM